MDIPRIACLSAEEALGAEHVDWSDLSGEAKTAFLSGQDRYGQFALAHQVGPLIAVLMEEGLPGTWFRVWGAPEHRRRRRSA